MFMQRDRSFIFFILSVCILLGMAQGTAAQETSVITGEGEEKDGQKRAQAVLLLRANLISSKSIRNLRQRADVIAEASSILWSYDRPIAKESLILFIEQCLTDYEELSAKERRTIDENATLGNLDYAIKRSLKALTQRDSKNGSVLQDKYFRIRETNLKAKNLSEELELAAQGLDIDEQRTLGMLKAIIQQRIPSQFPKLIFDLRKKNPVIAEILVQHALHNLSTNPNYKAIDAIYLSAIIFNEDMILVPVLSDVADPNRFGVFTTPLGSSGQSTSNENISLYFTALQHFFGSRLERGGIQSPQDLIQAYFVSEKSRQYGQKYGLADLGVLTRIRIQILASMHTSGFSEQTVSAVEGFALRLAHSNNPLGLDDGTDLLEKADNAKNPDEKLDFLIRGIIQLIEFKRYERAESKIFDVQSSDIREALYALLHGRAGLDAVKNKDWREFERRTEKIADNRTKAFLYLTAASDLELENKDTSSALEYLYKAEKNIQRISDLTARASAFVHLTFLAFSLDQTEGRLNWPAALKSINEAPDYNEDKFEINFKIPTRQIYYAEFIGSNSFRSLFAKLAETDWNDSQVQALQIKANGLQAIAQVAAAKVVLRKDNESSISIEQ